jgi:hypothetical protein
LYAFLIFPIQFLIIKIFKAVQCPKKKKNSKFT